MDNIIISGTSSGLGSYLKERMDCFIFERQKPDIYPKNKNNIIIHTAFDSSKNIEQKNILNYIENNFVITKKLLKIPHRKFIFISSVDVYSSNTKKNNENDEIIINEQNSIHSLSKIVCESLVKKMANRPTILRLSGMLGPNIRDNALMKIYKNSVDKSYKTITLDEQSEFNYVLQSDVLKLIELLVKNNDTGVYNICSNNNIKLKKVSDYLNSSIKFGNYQYNVGKNDNAKVKKKYGLFNKSSFQIIKEFLNDTKK